VLGLSATGLLQPVLSGILFWYRERKRVSLQVVYQRFSLDSSSCVSSAGNLSLLKTRNALSPLHFGGAAGILAGLYGRVRRRLARRPSVNRPFACGAVTRPAGTERPGEMAWFPGS